MGRRPKVIASQENAAVETLDVPPERRRGWLRLTATARNEILAALERGEKGAALAKKYNVSLGAIYSYRRKVNSASVAIPARQESELRSRLVNFAVRTLLAQAIDDDERGELERQVREELMKQVVVGI
jgi:hypothetical protein